MVYLLSGLAIGTFVSGLIAKFYSRESNFMSPKYLFGLSGLLLLIALLLG